MSSAVPLDLDDDGGGGTLVIEDGVIPRRVRRPVDLLRLAVALLAFAAIVAISYFLTATSTGIEQDITGAWVKLPELVRLAINVVAGLGILALPVAVAIDLVVRRRARQLVDAVGAMLIAVALAVLATWVATTYLPDRLLVAITGDPTGSRIFLNPLVAGLVAFVTVARLFGRGRWGLLGAITVVAVCVVPLTTSQTTAAVIGLSLLLGWVIGLATRYTLGTPTTRPSGLQVAEALERAGLPVTVLRANKNTARGRQYAAHTRHRERLRVNVYDRDLEGAGLAAAGWRQLRLRTDPANPSVFSMRAQLEHAALMSYAASAAGGRVPRLRAVAEVGPDSTLLAYDEVVGRTFAELEDGTVTDADLDAVYRAVRTLHDERIVHRALSPEQLIKADDGSVWLAGVQHGTIAASDVQERIDLAELLVTGALLTDVPRSVATGARVFGADRLTRALPALQTIALSPDTRRRLRGKKDVLVALRDELIALRPSAAETEQLELRRVKPRTLFTIVAGSIAAYVLLSQLAQVDLVGLFRQVQWNWALLALVLTVLTFVGASLSLSGFVPEKLSHVRTFAAQLAAGFATLVSPPTVGAVAVNVRYLQRSGLHPALAAASVGVSQVFAFFVHITLLFVTAIAAGQRADIHFTPPKAAVIGVVAVLVVLGLSLLFGPVRKTVVERTRPVIVEVGPRLLTVAQRPWKIVEGVGGILLLNGAFALCMIACCEAFGATDMNYAAVALVYLAGSTLGQAAPTPGGLGAVEAAYIAGLTLAGIDSSVAVSATLLFRLLTFWLPTIPGYWSFNWLQRVGGL
ncbi:MAG: lysylphosphatidylglycerol synthase transmembrane domain-containing protein [Actinomycetales bacterium]|nr:lysylphosphatidylglycerol synthase transmembrane domain-containing protein [Actinomycetales bacterium]